MALLTTQRGTVFQEHNLATKLSLPPPPRQQQHLTYAFSQYRGRRWYIPGSSGHAGRAADGRPAEDPGVPRGVDMAADGTFPPGGGGTSTAGRK